jgi:hypothetical protein
VSRRTERTLVDHRDAVDPHLSVVVLGGVQEKSVTLSPAMVDGTVNTTWVQVPTEPCVPPIPRANHRPTALAHFVSCAISAP